MRSWEGRSDMVVEWARVTVVVVLFIMIESGSGTRDELRMGFYAQSCPKAELIARNSLRRALFTDPTAPAALLRVVFHDCQVERCDASIMLDGPGNEKQSAANFGIRRLDFIDCVKKDLEDACPNTVSCADIIAMVGRDAVAFAGGPEIPLPMGRKDGLSSSNLKADAQLPPATSSVHRVIKLFKAYGMNMTEAVAILGAHTMGVGHCVNVVNRLYPHKDPTLSFGFYSELRMLCPTRRPSFTNITIIPTDKSSTRFDNQYFHDLLVGRGLFSVDSYLATDSRTKPIVQQFASNQNLFFETFVSAYTKLVTARVLTGSAGNVRTNCRRVN